MIDFRYHLVSLMAVLIALTMGVVLGAGPLQGSISSTLSGEVDRLKEKQDAWNQERNQLVTKVNLAEEYLSGMGEVLSDNLLSGHTVALVELPGVEDKDRSKVVSTIQEAGGKNSAQVQLSSDLFSENPKKNLKELAAKVSPVLDAGLVDPNDQTATVAAALIQSLVKPQDQGAALRSVFDKSGKDLVNSQFNQGGADLVLVIAPSQPKEEGKEQKTLQMKPEVAAKFAKGALLALPKGLVFTGNVQVKDGFLAGVEADNTLDRVSVSSWGAPGQAQTLPALLRYSLANGKGRFGAGAKRDGILPKDLVSVLGQTGQAAAGAAVPGANGQNGAPTQPSGNGKEK